MGNTIGWIKEVVYIYKTRLYAMYKLATISPKEYQAFMDSYVLFDGDWTNKNGKNESHIIDYYNVINHLCAMGNVEKMYIPPNMDPKKGVFQNQLLYEEKMMADISDTVKEGSKCLDIGCGRGRVAAHVASKLNCYMTGINIDPSQIQNAREHVKRVGLADKCNYIVGSLNDKLPFDDETFDGGYNIQAFTYSKDKDALFREIFRVLKPGAKFTFLDWVLLPNYDENNPTHVDLVARTMPFIGAVDNTPVSVFEQSMTKAGFKLLLSEDASIDGHQGRLISAEREHYSWVRSVVKFCVAFGLLPTYFPNMMKRLKTNADAFNGADELRIATSSYQFVIQKPAKLQ